MIKILIADDHAIVRRGLKEIILRDFHDAEIGEAQNGNSLLQFLRSGEYDVIITDLSMPGMNGLDLLKQLKLEFPRIPVLVLSMFPEEQYGLRVLKAGATGYLNKENSPEEIVKALQQILMGKKYISEVIAELLAENIGKSDSLNPHADLSDREFEVLRMIAGGKSVSEIARQLSLSVNTISTYRGRILEKMSLKSNAELVQYAFENKLA